MTHRQFHSLALEKKIEAIKQEGTFLYVRNEAGVDVVLYQIGSFYAEVFFEAECSDKLRIQSFEDTALLDAYLQDINISDIQQLL